LAKVYVSWRRGAEKQPPRREGLMKRMFEKSYGKIIQ
jgi:hypothetical protein